MSISIGKTSYGQENLIYIGDKLVSEIYSGNELVFTDDGVIFTKDKTYNNYNKKKNK